jgi:transcriptional regulator GlxA family with amidase domain
MNRRVYFILFPGCEILDVAGPVQALSEAASYGTDYDIQYCALTPSIRTAQGLEIGALHSLPDVTRTDWVFVPGYPIRTVQPPLAQIEWLRQAALTGARLCSVCTGAFALGQAGLLDERTCTTHWKHLNELRSRYPRAHVIDDRLYVVDGPIVTSAGIAAGIDMTIGLVEQDAGAVVASAVAREMVIYMRRDGTQPQISIYLEYQNHLNAGVHQVQQYLINNPTSEATLEDLAAIAHVSPRHLTRTFRRVTGISVGEFRLRLRLETAQTLMQQSHLKIEAIALECGFSDARQLRRLWARHFGSSPLTFRHRIEAAIAMDNQDPSGK